MADKPKRVSRPPKRFIEEYTCSNPVVKKEKTEKDNNLYEVEIKEVDKGKKRLKIYFVAWFSDQYDEWRDFDSGGNYFPFVRLVNIFIPGEGSLEDRRNIVHGQVYYRTVKRIKRLYLLAKNIYNSIINNNTLNPRFLQYLLNNFIKRRECK
jgi:hypothetical protein